MIARHWIGITKFEEVENYLAYLHHERFPYVATIDGYVRTEILTRKLEEGIEFLIISYWASLESLKQFAGENYERAVVPEKIQSMFLSYEDTARHYEVFEGQD